MTPPRQFVPPAALAAGYAALVAAVIGYWGADLSAVDRYLILAAAVWAGVKQWPAVTAGAAPRPWVGVPLVAAGAALYPVGWAAYFVLSNARSVPFWVLWLALTLTTSGCVLAAFGGRAAYRSLFPLLFVAFALPPPESLLRVAQHRLQAVTTDLSEWLLKAVGYDVHRPPGGFVLALPGGELGVEEACSGVLALTTLTAAAAFFAFVRRASVPRGGLILTLAVPVVILVNVLRVTLSGVIQESAGTEYIRGGWHESLGVCVVGLGLGVVFLLAKLFAPRPKAVPSPPPIPLQPFPRVVVVTLAASALLSVWAVWHGRTLVPPPVPAPALHDLPPQFGEWSEFARRPVPPHVMDLLHPDVIVHREYRNPLGRSATVWVIYWTSAHAVRGYHHPDVCLPNVGYREAARGVVTLTPAGGGELAVTSRTLAGGTGDLYVLYWTQTGRRVWGEADEAEAEAGMRFDELAKRAARRWTGPPPEPAGRLVVLVGSPHATGYGRGEVEAFARQLADEVYRLCPSASGPLPP